MKKSQNPRFEVDFKARLKQSQEASNAVRMPRLGYAIYRVYDIEPKKDKVALNSQYGQHIGRAIRPGPMNILYGSVGTGKSSYNIKTLKLRQSRTAQIYGHQITWAFFDDLAPLFDPVYNLVWLKPKHVTLLRMKGHRVEPAQPGDKSMTIQGKSGPVSIGA
jgi:hypothetical protein